MATDVDTSVVSPENVKATCAEKNMLAFLPNRMPTYKAEDNTHMFSLFYDTPSLDQQWRIMLRGETLPKLLVEEKTISFLESIKGGVDWKALPPNNNSGSSGIIFDASTIESEDNLATLFGNLNLCTPPNSDTTDELEIKVEEDADEEEPKNDEKASANTKSSPIKGANE